jgi:hypothetical protein
LISNIFVHEPNIIRGYNQGFRKGYGTFAILFVQKPVISHEKGKENGVVAKQNEHIRNYLEHHNSERQNITSEKQNAYYTDLY